MTDAEAFRWVGDEQERYLEDSASSAWESSWPEYLGRYLDHSWSGWQQEDDERRRDWLDERVRSIALGWLTTEQRNGLDQLAANRGDWREWVPQQLDQWWPDWSKAGPDELTTWFDSALASLIPQPEAAPPAAVVPATDPRALGWLTPEQQTQLDTLTVTRGDWHTWLPLQMDEWWAGWEQSDPAQLTTWFESALPSLVAPAVDAAESPAAAEEFDPRSLDWVTAEQQSSLDEFAEIRGDWREWLAADLDRRREDWTTLPPDELAPWLDLLIPLLALPEADDFLDAILGALDQDEEMLELAAELTPQELAQVIEDVYAALAA
ncbi:hypothetical protein AB0P21_17760 [Kribbella sp. NPDC056861]|uniref:hypothetical protein n=1 Tax=Kribbella sp. NPDC056861 TaxID=3154857 RepID=UPI0034411F17